MHSLVAEIFDGLSDSDLTQLQKKAGVSKKQLLDWKSGTHVPKVDTFSRVALCAGFKLVALPLEFVKEKPNMSKTDAKLQVRQGRPEVWRKNQLIGYVDDERLFAIDRKNYAVEVGPVNHSREIIGKLLDWRKGNGYE